MECHKTQQSHANDTTMGRFPRLTPVRLSPQVPDHMTVSEDEFVLYQDGAFWFVDEYPSTHLMELV